MTKLKSNNIANVDHIGRALDHLAVSLKYEQEERTYAMLFNLLDKRKEVANHYDDSTPENHEDYLAILSSINKDIINVLNLITYD